MSAKIRIQYINIKKHISNNGNPFYSTPNLTYSLIFFYISQKMLGVFAANMRMAGWYLQSPRNEHLLFAENSFFLFCIWYIFVKCSFFFVPRLRNLPTGRRKDEEGTKKNIRHMASYDSEESESTSEEEKSITTPVSQNRFSCNDLSLR